MKPTISILGGDQRSIYVARLLEEGGLPVETWGLEKGDAPHPVPLDRALEAAVLILPLPMCREGNLNLPLSDEELDIDALWPHLHRDQVVMGGMTGALAPLVRDRWGLTLLDYADRESFRVANAALTARAAVLRAEEERSAPLTGAEVLVLGGGRIGKCTTWDLLARGARVTVAARSAADLAWAQAAGADALPLSKLTEKLRPVSLAVNTIPALVLGREALLCLPPDCLILELASAPGGVDREEAARLGRRVLPLPGLPGRQFPQGAARAILDSVLRLLAERGVLL